MNKFSFEAVIFDLDGVITKTALVHSAAWREMFNDYLRYRKEKYREPFREFRHNEDYLPYVDGKPRYKGVASFLKSRKIVIPFGDPSDDPDSETICGLGNKKNRFFNEILERDGVEVFDSTISLIKDLKNNNIKVGIASSSKNCKAILDRCGLAGLFETCVDGEVSAKLGLKGKPEPDIFTTACDNLGAEYEKSVVVEDAVSGVQAGEKGKFGLVLGIAREGNTLELKRNGADIVVDDIAELGGINAIDQWFKEGLEREKWSLSYSDYDPGNEKSREALLACGNGFFAARGSMDEASANEINYPGTYISGMYNRLVSTVAGKKIENEDLVNCPNWLKLTFSIDEGPWFDPNKWEVISIERRLTFHDGLLSRSMVVSDRQGKQTRIQSERIIDMDDPHLAAIRYCVTPLNYSGSITFNSSLEGSIINDGVERYRQLNQKHLDPVKEGGKNNLQYLLVRTSQSKKEIAEASLIRAWIVDKEVFPDYLHLTSPGKIDSEFQIPAGLSQTVTIEKVVSVFTSLEEETGHTLESAIDKVKIAGRFSHIHLKSAGRWAELWNEMDIKISGDRYAQKLIRLHIFHLMVTASPHYSWQDAGIPARGLHGEAYRGHIFWDELYILPFYCLHLPEVARAVLMYRYRRLDKARNYAREHGYKGAMYPWQSGSDGREETQVIHLNPVSGEWGDDYSSLQRHISIAVAYNVWYYFWITGDEDFMLKYGNEVFFEICRFWVSKCEKDNEGRYSIQKVMGPDEFHEKLPDSDKDGLKDNAYTNIMVVWLLNKAAYLIRHFGQVRLKGLFKKLVLDNHETRFWEEVTKNMRLIISDDGIISQFDGYFNLQELDWEAYLKEYDNIHRIDRILKSEGKSPDDYKVAKQADTLMTFYNLDPDEVIGIIKGLGYNVQKTLLRDNFDYYIQRTSHGSTLSRVVHAYLYFLLRQKQDGWKMYMEALSSDYVDIQGGTTAEGIHAGVMGATVLFVLTSFAGIHYKTGILKINPCLPSTWKNIRFNIAFRENYYTFDISESQVRIKVENSQNEQVEVEVGSKKIVLNTGQWNEIGILVN